MQDIAFVFHKTPKFKSFAFDVLASKRFIKKHPRIVKELKEITGTIQTCMYVKKFKRKNPEYREHEVIATCDFIDPPHMYDALRTIQQVLNLKNVYETEIVFY